MTCQLHCLCMSHILTGCMCAGSHNLSFDHSQVRMLLFLVVVSPVLFIKGENIASVNSLKLFFITKLMACDQAFLVTCKHEATIG